MTDVLPVPRKTEDDPNAMLVGMVGGLFALPREERSLPATICLHFCHVVPRRLTPFEVDLVELTELAQIMD